ncbi:DUF1127 domain-containing protein [Reyranella sp.]|uniref:DUF1127 domain-containing protein n=1 Tax=Reyranella sp. TaxID=1929291 RepID=UPI003BAB1E5B
MADLSLHYASKTPLAGTAGAFAAFHGILATWRRRSRERQELATMDQRVLRDVGLSASEVAFEANKPFWRA